MSIVRGVVYDLYTFVISEFKTLRSGSVPTMLTDYEESIFRVAARYPDTALRTVSETVATPAIPHTQLSAAVDAPVTPSVSLRFDVSQLSFPQRIYIALDDVRGYNRPVQAFDEVVCILSFGTAVTALSQQGGWIEIVRNEDRCWVQATALTHDKTLVEAQFASGVVYDAQHEETVKLRTALHDQFAAAPLFLPLQDVELVSYRFQQTGQMIPWPRPYGRLPGPWQRLLRGVRGVHIGLKPRTKAVYEWVDEHGLAHVALVLEVHPDNSILLETVGLGVAGRFEQRLLFEQEWQAQSGVFIALT